MKIIIKKWLETREWEKTEAGYAPRVAIPTSGLSNMPGTIDIPDNYYIDCVSIFENEIVVYILPKTMNQYKHGVAGRISTGDL